MKLLIPHDSVEDCNLRWSKCYCKYTPPEGKQQYLYINVVRDIDGDRVLIRGALYSEEDSMWENFSELWVTNDQLDMTHIATGNVDIGNAARYVSKARGSSYRLGVTEQRYRVSTPCSTMLTATGHSSGTSFGAVVPRMYNPTYRSLKESVKLILNKSVISSSVSKHISIGLSTDVSNIALYRGTSLIGEYDHNAEVARLPYKHRYFEEEVQEAGFEVELIKEESNG